MTLRVDNSQIPALILVEESKALYLSLYLSLYHDSWAYSLFVVFYAHSRSRQIRIVLLSATKF